MVLKLYNTLSREKEELHPIHPDWVGLYTCGPTVYNFAHIGNLRTYVFEDILERTLRYDGYIVRRVMNITDVGHLTGDTDAGDDKLDKEAQAQKKTVQELAKFYTNAFFADIAKLNILKPDIVAPASEFVREQISLIQTLFEKGYAYDTPKAVYFDVSKFKNYGALSGQSLEEKSVGARAEVVVDDEKRNAADFALWFKLEGKFKKHLLHWPSPWGEGFPGWHIECSAISRHFLGQPFDIHTGGVDHIGTHHTNEIAQSEAAYGVPLAHLWVHGEHLFIDNGKMAKSEADKFITLTELQKRGYHPLIFRYLILGAHYRSRLNFTWESLEAAKNGLEHIYQGIYALAENADEKKRIIENASIPNDDSSMNNLKTTFEEAINDDLNTAKALAVLSEIVFGDYDNFVGRLELIKQIDEVLGLELDKPMSLYSYKNDIELANKIEQYRQFRGSKQFIQSDALRNEIESLGYEVRDTEQGPVIVKKFF